MDWLVYPIRDLLEWTFSFIPALGEPINNSIIALISFGIVVWVALMFKYQKDEISNSPDNPL